MWLNDEQQTFPFLVVEGPERQAIYQLLLKHFFSFYVHIYFRTHKSEGIAKTTTDIPNSRDSMQ